MLDLSFEREIFQDSNIKRIVGIDEVGRGCWAGPIYVGSFVVHRETPFVEQINDSKLLTANIRDQIFQKLDKDYFRLGIGSVMEINNDGLGKTLTRLIQELIDQFDPSETVFLIDGYFARDFGTSSYQIVKGDTKYYSIAAAAILAKVARDNFMKELDKDYPNYGFAKHKGYGTRSHREALSQFGVSDVHRHYMPVKKLLDLEI